MEDNNNLFNSENSQEYSFTPNTNYEQKNDFNNTEPNSPKPPKDKKPKTFGISAMIICIVLSVILSAGTSLVIAFSTVKTNKDNNESLPNNVSSMESLNSEGQSSTPDETPSVSDIENLVETVYDKASISVVGIRTKSYIEHIFGGSQQVKGEGSGVIFTQDGYIVTNYHVIQNVANNHGNSSIEVYLMSNPEEPINAEIVGYNISADLAVLKIEKSGLVPAEMFKDTDTLKVGQFAIAIGCPGGLEFFNSVSYGIISGLNRTITLDSIGEMHLIQTDAAINPGNSGGALLNSAGQLIGINASKLVDESFEGMGFAIPVNTVLDVVKEIMENKDNPTPYIGLEIYKFEADYLDRYNLPHGAAVKGVVPNAPAYNAGIREGDIITKFNHVKIDSYKEFFDAVDKCKPNTVVTVEVYRKGKYYRTSVTIGSNNSH